MFYYSQPIIVLQSYKHNATFICVSIRRESNKSFVSPKSPKFCKKCFFLQEHTIVCETSKAVIDTSII